MKRAIDPVLDSWTKLPHRMPLIIRGARQVGKSHSVRSLAQRRFDSCITINFEQEAAYSNCFDSLKASEILKRLEYVTGERVQPGKSLLFFDEIQLCPRALQSLRYFKEELPELHVIAAGSLLEFLLEEEKFSYPVGRVSFLQMNPLSFEEFLLARSQESLLAYIQSLTLQSPFDPVAHEALLKQVREYTFVGGMPQALSIFLSANSFIEVQRYHQALFDLYRLDFGKYAQKTKIRPLLRLFDRTPELVGQHFRYSKIDPESSNPSRDYKEALTKLCQARVLSKMHASAANGLPLQAEIREKSFKIFLLDVGLLQTALGVKEVDATAIHIGSLAEQFVAQELLAYSDPYFDAKLFFWESTKASSSAEVDFISTFANKILPIEVKASSTGRLKSLHQFMELRKLDLGIHISTRPLEQNGKILSVPFYLLGQLSRLLQ